MLDVLTVTKNRLNALRHNVKSVEGQTCRRDINHILVDGSSSDGTSIQLAEKFDEAHIIIDTGLYNGLNQAHKHLSGEFVMYLHSDDILFDASTVQFVLQKIRTDDADVLFFNVVLCDRKWVPKRHYKSSKYKLNLMNWGIMPAHTGMVIRRSLLDKIGNYNEQYKISADFDFLYRMKNQEDSLKIRFYDRTLVKMSLGGASTGSLKKKLDIIKEQVQILRSHGCKYNLIKVCLGKAMKVFI